MGYADEAKAGTIRDYVTGAARGEIDCAGPDVQKDPAKLIELLKKRFGKRDTLQVVSAKFHSRVRSSQESLADFSRSLMQLRARMEALAEPGAERDSVKQLAEKALKEQFAAGCNNKSVQEEINRSIRSPDNPSFAKIREHILDLYGNDDSHSGSCGSKLRSNEASVDCDRVETNQNCSSDAILEHPIIKILVQGQQALQGQVGELMTQQSKVLEQLSRSTSSGFGRGRALGNSQLKANQRPRTLGPCWFCQTEGHVQKDCVQYKEHRAKLARPTGQGVSDSKQEEN
jgi:hypothetical protein